MNGETPAAERLSVEQIREAELERLRALERAVDSLFDGLVHSMADLFALYKEADGWDEVLALAVDEIRESRAADG